MKLSKSQYFALAFALAAGLGVLVERQTFDPQVTGALAFAVAMLKAYLTPPSTPQE